MIEVPHIARNARVSGKVALVAGAGSVADGVGNGRAAALLLAINGAKVVLVDASEAAAQETARLVRANDGECVVVRADVTVSEDCKAAVDVAMHTWGRLDTLVNNVGTIGPSGTAVDVDIDAWDEAMRVNVKSVMLMARHAVPCMISSGGGSIINIGSYMGLYGGHPSLFYPTSKGALPNMTRTMAGHHGVDGIRVNCVCPGSVFTPLVAGDLSPEAREVRRQRTLLKTEGTGWDVGYAVLFLASDESRWITGTTLLVDGGKGAGLPAGNAVPASAIKDGGGTKA